jgi:hypothetical protein
MKSDRGVKTGSDPARRKLLPKTQQEVKTMFCRLRNSALMGILIIAMASIAPAQGPLRKIIHFSINVTYTFRNSDLVLPPGDYTLYQIDPNDTSIFALYHGPGRKRSPIAMIKTVRIEYNATKYPEDTTLLYNLTASRSEPLPVVNGWTLPSQQGWEIIGIVSKSARHLAKSN